jgi:hypothetical protein
MKQASKDKHEGERTSKNKQEQTSKDRVVEKGGGTEKRTEGSSDTCLSRISMKEKG